MGWSPTRWVGGEEGGFKKLREMGSLLDYQPAGEKLFSLPETLVPLLTKAASAPWHPSHAGAGGLHTKSCPRQGGGGEGMGSTCPLLQQNSMGQQAIGIRGKPGMTVAGQSGPAAAPTRRWAWTSPGPQKPENIEMTGDISGQFWIPTPMGLGKEEGQKDFGFGGHLNSPSNFEPFEHPQGGLGWVGRMPVTSLDVSRSASIVVKWEPTCQGVSGCPAPGTGLSGHR